MITICSDKEAVYHEMEVECTDEAKQLLLNYAKERILEDEPALMNYAFNRILREQIERESGKEKEAWEQDAEATEQ